MQKKVSQDKEFRTLKGGKASFRLRRQMQKPSSINELLHIRGKRLAALKATLAKRSAILAQVRAALPPQLAAAIVSAGLERGCLTIGVTGAPWAARLRYVIDTLRLRVGASMGDVQTVRIKVVPPRL